MTHEAQREGVVSRVLDTGWTLRAAGGPVPEALQDREIGAVVPGVVHLDLINAGLIPNPYLDDNEALLAWIGLTDWTYRTTLTLTADDLTAHRRHDLVFDGIDTVATIAVNGTEVARVSNQHRTHRFDVADLLVAGDNELVVAFTSPVRWANEQSLALGPRPGPYPFPYEAIRKSACNFGWDWGINTSTSGLWRPVRLESWSIARLGTVLVRAMPDAEGEGGLVEARVVVDRASDTDLELDLRLGDVVETVRLPAGETEAVVSVRHASVERWWPVGHGDQPLYAVRLSLRSGETVLDEAIRQVGFRTVRWASEPDEAGTSFELLVNDRPVLVKGVNWIPDDAFPSRVGRDRYAHRLGQAVAANLNLVRVWGGGIYESDDFYDLCDELGLLTWQDFLFACAAYPEEEPLRGEVEAEARDNVARLAHHASLVMLCGNNENLWGHDDWGWEQLLDGRTWGAHYYDVLLPAVVDELAPQVPYTPGSPFSPGGQHPNDPAHGSTHLWEQWNQLDWTTYRDVRPRFVAEFGWQGPPTWTTLTDSLSDDPLTPESPGMLVHQKAFEGNTKLTRGLVPHYRVPVPMERWHWAMQLNQANAITAALEWFRSLAPTTSGAVVWQLNDCWPVTSWAAIDGAGRAKPLWFALQNAFAPRLVTIQRAATGLVAVLGNDSDDGWAGEVVVTRRRMTGEPVGQAMLLAEVAPRGSLTVELPEAVGTSVDPAAEVLVVEAMDTRAMWFFVEPRDSALAPPRLSVEVEAEPGGDAWLVHVTAEVLLRDLTLLVDKLHPDAVVDRGLVTLLPGERTAYRVVGPEHLDVESVLAPGVLCSGNDLVEDPARPLLRPPRAGGH